MQYSKHFMKHKKKEHQFNIKLFSTHQILNICYMIITAVIKEDLLSTVNILNGSSLTF